MLCELDGVKVNVSAVSEEGTCIVNFGMQLRRFHRYIIRRTTEYKDDKFSGEKDFFHFHPRVPTVRLVIRIDFSEDAGVTTVARSFKGDNNQLDQGTVKVEDGMVEWVIWFPKVGREYWIKWSRA